LDTYNNVFYNGFSKSLFKYFSSAGATYSEDVLLRSGIISDDGATLYVSFVQEETASEYGYRLDVEITIVGSYIVSAIIDEHYYQSEEIVYSRIEQAEYGHEPKTDYPYDVDLLDYSQYQELSA
jgi:hypothetical protein